VSSGLKQTQDSLDLVSAVAQEWQYLLPVEVGPRLVERYAGGKSGLYLQCEFNDVSGAGGGGHVRKRSLELIWQVEGCAAERGWNRSIEVANCARGKARENRMEFAVRVSVSDAIKQPERFRTRELPSFVRLRGGYRFSVRRSKIAELGIESLLIVRVSEVSNDREIRIVWRPDIPRPGLGPTRSPLVFLDQSPGEMIESSASVRREVANEKRPLWRKVGRLDESQSAEDRLHSPVWGEFGLRLLNDCAFLYIQPASHLRLKLAEMFVCPREFALGSI